MRNKTGYCCVLFGRFTCEIKMVSLRSKNQHFLGVFFQSPHNEVMYTLTGDSTAMEYFMVNPNTGHISLKKSVVLDPERRTTYNLQVSARDRGEPTTKAATNRSASTLDLPSSTHIHPILIKIGQCIVAVTAG